jgi:hypothetical protein
MKNIKLAFTTAALVALAAPAAMASTILVDDFTATGYVAATLNGNPAEIDVSNAGILGGNRTMWVSTDVPTMTFGTAFSVSAGLGVLDFANGPSSTGQAVLVYDSGIGGTPFAFTFAGLAPGVSNSINVNTSGLNSTDLLMGGTTATRNFTFSGSQFDVSASAVFRAYAWDMDGDLVEYSQVLDDQDFTDVLKLNQFGAAAGGNGTFDWTKVGALAFSIESTTTNFDGSIGTILLLGGLGGLFGMSTAAKRRRRNKA